jgi:hypothetical protein
MRARDRAKRLARRAALASVAAAWAAAIACSSGCAPTSTVANQEACYTETNARVILRAKAECKGYTWDECPKRDAINAWAREEREQCRP